MKKLDEMEEGELEDILSQGVLVGDGWITSSNPGMPGAVKLEFYRDGEIFTAIILERQQVERFVAALMESSNNYLE